MDNFLSLIEEDKRIIEDRLDLVYKNQNEFEKMCAYSFTVGGKRIRAILLLESFKSYKEVFWFSFRLCYFSWAYT